MKYYRFKISTNNKIIGRYPQADKLTLGYDVKADNSIRKVRGTSPIVVDPNLDGFLLHGKAKRTDLLSCSQIFSWVGLLVSDQLYNCLSEFNLLSHQVYDAFVYKRDSKFEYKLLWGNEGSNDYLDFNQSSFFEGNNLRCKIGNVKIDNIHTLSNDLKKLSKIDYLNRTTINLEKIIFDSKKIKLDLFRLEDVFNSYFISERLLNRLLELGLTGFDYEDVENLKINVLPAHHLPAKDL